MGDGGADVMERGNGGGGERGAGGGGGIRKSATALDLRSSSLIPPTPHPPTTRVKYLRRDKRGKKEDVELCLYIIDYDSQPPSTHAP